MLGFLNRFLDVNKKEVNRLQELVDRANQLADKYKKIKKDDQFAAETANLKKRFSDGETLDQLLPDAFALAREAGRRGIPCARHFPF